MSKRKITISDVAHHAGVAQSTVSLVLNKRGRVSQETRVRVQQVMAELGYRPRPNAARPRRHVAVIYSHEMIFCKELIYYCRDWIAGIRDELSKEQSADISVFCGREHVSQDQMFQVAMREKDFDGLVVMGMLPRHGYLDYIIPTRVPMVVLNQRPLNTEFSSVSIDHRAAGRKVIEHLLSLGHRRIGIFMRQTHEISLGKKDLAEYVKAQGGELVGLSTHNELDFEDLAAIRSIAQSILDQRITAAWSGDPLAYRLANAFEELGVSVPGQMSLVGFDNLGLRTNAGLRLCTLDSDMREMGRLAGQTLENLWKSQGSVNNFCVNVPARFHLGQTTGPCPQTMARPAMVQRV